MCLLHRSFNATKYFKNVFQIRVIKVEQCISLYMCSEHSDVRYIGVGCLRRLRQHVIERGNCTAAASAIVQTRLIHLVQ